MYYFWIPRQTVLICNNQELIRDGFCGNYVGPFSWKEFLKWKQFFHRRYPGLELSEHFAVIQTESDWLFLREKPEDVVLKLPTKEERERKIRNSSLVLDFINGETQVAVSKKFKLNIKTVRDIIRNEISNLFGDIYYINQFKNRFFTEQLEYDCFVDRKEDLDMRKYFEKYGWIHRLFLESELNETYDPDEIYKELIVHQKLMKEKGHGESKRSDAN